MRSKLLTHLGYYMVDHRNSPGITGKIAEMDPSKMPVGANTMMETDIVTCSHCQAVVRLNPYRDSATHPRNWCAKCDRYICDAPVCLMQCRPYLAYLDELDRQDKIAGVFK